VVQITTDNITSDSKIITVEDSGETFAVPVEKLHYININTLLIQLPETLPNSFNVIRDANKTYYDLTKG
jgi:hypothetical protein